jgi:hypothetical protein
VASFLPPFSPFFALAWHGQLLYDLGMDNQRRRISGKDLKIFGCCAFMGAAYALGYCLQFNYGLLEFMTLPLVGAVMGIVVAWPIVLLTWAVSYLKDRRSASGPQQQ